MKTNERAEAERLRREDGRSVREIAGCLAVHDTRIVQSIFGSIQEYGGFERPEWLG